MPDCAPCTVRHFVLGFRNDKAAEVVPIPNAPEPPHDQKPEPKSSAAEHRYAYAKDRYEAAGDDLKEARTWARQLVATPFIVFTLELRLLGGIASNATLGDPFRFTCALLVGLAIAMQIFPTVALVGCAYVGTKTKQPERPAHQELLNLLAGDGREVARVIAAYYAKGDGPPIPERSTRSENRCVRRLSGRCWLARA